MHWRRLKTFCRVHMPSVIRRYLSRELLLYWSIFTLVLWLVLVTARFSLYLGQAADGRLPAATVLTLLGLKSVGFCVFLLPVTLYLALLWLLGRLNRDHEALALGASGVGQLQLYRAIAWPVLLAALLVAVLSFQLVPYTAQQGYRLRAEAQRHIDAGALTPGRFHTLRSGRWLVYAQRAGPAAGQLEDVFIHVQQSRPQVLVAKQASIREREGQSRFLVLQDGYRYDGVPGQADYRILRYREYALRLQPQPVQAGHKWDAVSTSALIDDASPAARTELQVRGSRPLSVLVLTLLAVPLARFRPATGRFYPLWLGVLVFALYFNLLATAQLWLVREQLPAWLGLWWVHLLFAVLAVVLVRPWRSVWRRVAA
jgi:lipopolysaccharide export system permease protein